MEERVGAAGLILALAGLLLLGVPIVGWLFYILGLVVSFWGVFRARPHLAWWGITVSVASAVLRLTVSIFIAG
ncbi:hypothetical protein [Lacticaseibacillus camelliae]|uniref:Uncharacterized protein n=1 Tax=Lacticaseibacillus camelliae DSM 22697 = JCM 13995 TaxID=1423730 RepID=A0A0R2FE42_9LACO|nr:hypothetical protein [Lacticaseibacillus camelliae]KRN25611.1 hypothetical protein FC75_GL000148 [Lacticaseibacillus camelliae DSM 22697 = JCM 13995]